MESPLRRYDDLALIETFGWSPRGGFVRLDAHLARLRRGAARLGVPLHRRALDAALLGVAGSNPLRVRLTVDAMLGAVGIETAPAPAPVAEWRAVVAEQRLRSGDPWLTVKTTHRPGYDEARAALAGVADEAILLNERGEVCDGTITTVFADLGEGLVTPPLTCGLLPGVLRAELLASGACREAVVRAGDLRGARLFLGNSLRGLIPARLAEP